MVIVCQSGYTGRQIPLTQKGGIRKQAVTRALRCTVQLLNSSPLAAALELNRVSPLDFLQGIYPVY